MDIEEYVSCITYDGRVVGGFEASVGSRYSYGRMGWDRNVYEILP